MTTKDFIGGVIGSVLLAAVVVWFVYWQLPHLANVGPFGSVIFGTTLGWVMRFFLRRLTQFTVKEFSALVSALVGALMVGLFDRTPSEMLLFFYLTGLGFGYFSAQVWNLFVDQPGPANPNHPASGRNAENSN